MGDEMKGLKLLYHVFKITNSMLLKKRCTLLVLIATPTSGQSKKSSHQDAITRLLRSSLDELRAFFNVIQTNESGLFHDIARCQTSFLMLVPITEEMLLQQRFRKLLSILVGARVSLAFVKQANLTAKTVTNSFTYLSRRRAEKVAELVDDAIPIDTVDQTEVIRHVRQRYQAQPVLRMQPRVHQSQSSFLHQLNSCLVLNKAKLSVNPLHYSYNMPKTSRKTFQLTRTITTMHKTEVTIDVEKTPPENHTPVIPKCPIIEISSSDTSSNSAQSLQQKHPDIMSSQIRKSSDYMQCPRITQKRLSFEYETRTYAVTDTKKNSLLYVNFPYTDSAEGDTAIQYFNSRFFTPRASSSSEEFGIEINTGTIQLDSPLPQQQLDSERKKIFQYPLPAFNAELCFPPVGLVSCDQLQRKRPSIFDVLS